MKELLIFGEAMRLNGLSLLWFTVPPPPPAPTDKPQVTPRKGFTGKGKNITTKHDEVLCGRKNTARMDNVRDPPNISSVFGSAISHPLVLVLVNLGSSHPLVLVVQFGLLSPSGSCCSVWAPLTPWFLLFSLGSSHPRVLFLQFAPEVLVGDGLGMDLKLSNQVFNSLKQHCHSEQRRSARLHDKKEHSTAVRPDHIPTIREIHTEIHTKHQRDTQREIHKPSER